jgi:hypothetical protein
MPSWYDSIFLLRFGNGLQKPLEYRGLDLRGLDATVADHRIAVRNTHIAQCRKWRRRNRFTDNCLVTDLLQVTLRHRAPVRGTARI